MLDMIDLVKQAILHMIRQPCFRNHQGVRRLLSLSDLCFYVSESIPGGGGVLQRDAVRHLGVIFESTVVSPAPYH